MGQRGHGSRKVTRGPLWLAHNLKEQLIIAIKKSEHFAIQLNETTDVGSDPQLMVYVRYRGEWIGEEMLFCRLLETTTRGVDIFKNCWRVFNIARCRFALD